MIAIYRSDDLTAIDDNDAGSERPHLVGMMGRDDHTMSLRRESLYRREDRPTNVNVQTRSRFVEKKQLGVVEDRRGDRRTLAHTRRVVSAPAIEKLFEPHFRGDFFDPLTHRITGEPAQASDIREILPGGETVIEAETIPKENSDASFTLDRSFVGADRTRDDTKKRRFSGAVRTQQSDHLSGLYRSRHVVNRRNDGPASSRRCVALGNS